MKKRAGLMLLLTLMLSVLLALPAAAAVKVPDPTKEFYVNDFAGVLSDTTKKAIMGANISLQEQTGEQIVVVTVDFLDNAEIEDYSYALFNQWKIGSKENNGGILLLLAIGEENYHVLTGYGISQELTAGVVKQQLLTNLEPDFAVQNYDEGVQKTFHALATWCESYYGISLGEASSGSLENQLGTWEEKYEEYQQNGTEMPQNYRQERSRSNLFSSMSTIIFFMVIAVVFSSFFRSGRRRRYYGGGGFGGGYNNSSFWPFFLGSLWGSSQNRHRHNGSFWDDDDDHHHPGGFGGGGFGGFGGGGFGGGSSGGGFSGGGGGSDGGGAGRF